MLSEIQKFGSKKYRLLHKFTGNFRGYILQVRKQFLWFSYWVTIKKFKDEWIFYPDNTTLNFAYYDALEILNKLENEN